MDHPRDPKEITAASNDEHDELISRRKFVQVGAVATGAVVVWTSPWPFSDAGVGQLIDNAAASPTGSHTPTQYFDNSADNGGQITAYSGHDGGVSVNNFQQSVGWPADALPDGAIVTLTYAPLAAVTDGFAAGSDAVDLTVMAGGVEVTSFAKPIVIHFANAQGKVPSYIKDGVVIPITTQLTSVPLTTRPPDDAYFVNPDGSVDIYTWHATVFGALKDTQAPTAPANLAGSFSAGSLVLTWDASTDNSGTIASYRLELNDAVIGVYSAATLTASVRTFVPHASSSFALRALDPSGNVSDASTPVVVDPSTRPDTAPKHIPQWAWDLLKWENQPIGARGPRPTAPSPLPSWYRAWKAWRLAPFHLA